MAIKINNIHIPAYQVTAHHALAVKSIKQSITMLNAKNLPDI